jgi:hypothetical protein
MLDHHMAIIPLKPFISTPSNAWSGLFEQGCPLVILGLQYRLGKGTCAISNSSICQKNIRITAFWV